MPRTAANSLTAKGSDTRRLMDCSTMQVAEGGSHHTPDSQVPCMNSTLFTVQPLCQRSGGRLLQIQSGAHNAELFHAELQGRAVQAQPYRGAVRSGKHPSSFL